MYPPANAEHNAVVYEKCKKQRRGPGSLQKASDSLTGVWAPPPPLLDALYA